MIIHMRHTLWTGISETNVNVLTSATRTHAFNNNQTFHGGWLLAILNIFSVVIIRTQKHTDRQTDRQTVENTVWIAL